MLEDILPPTVPVAVPRLSDREVLEHTKQLKLQMLAELIDENHTPSDPKDVKSVLAIVDSLDASALGSIRSNQEASSSANAQEAMRLIAQITSNLGNNNPYLAEIAIPREVIIEASLVETNFVPGETEVGMRDVEYDTFVEEYETKHDV